MSGGTAKGSTTRPWSSRACQIITPRPITAAAPTISPRLCSASDSRSFQRRTRRCASCSSRCSCRCSVCSSIRWVCLSRNAAALASSGLDPRPARPSASATAAGLAWSSAASVSASGASWCSAMRALQTRVVHPARGHTGCEASVSDAARDAVLCPVPHAGHAPAYLGRTRPSWQLYNFDQSAATGRRDQDCAPPMNDTCAAAEEAPISGRFLSTRAERVQVGP